jgi:hypothetical protein
MSKSLTILFITLIQAFNLFGQTHVQLLPFTKSRGIQLRIQGHEILATDKGFNLDLLIENKTDTTFILYCFKIIGDGYGGENSYKKSKITGGSAIFLQNMNNNLELDGKLERSRFRSDFSSDSVKKVYDESVIVIKAREKMRINIPVKLRQGFLRKGNYPLHLLYYCGVNIVNLFPSARIHSDMKKHRAFVFQGYLESNKVTLKVTKTHPAQRLDDYLNSN